MKTINLLSIFSLCSLIIFSANGMENNEQLSLEESVRIIPSKTEKKGWYAGFTDYMSGYKNNTEKALEAYLNKKNIPENQKESAIDYTTWGLQEQNEILITFITKMNPIRKGEKLNLLNNDLSILNKPISKINNLLSRARLHNLNLANEDIIKTVTLLDTALEINTSANALIINNTLQNYKKLFNIAQTIKQDKTTCDNIKRLTYKNNYITVLKKEMTILYNQQLEKNKK